MLPKKDMVKELVVGRYCLKHSQPGQGDIAKIAEGAIMAYDILLAEIEAQQANQATLIMLKGKEAHAQSETRF